MFVSSVRMYKRKKFSSEPKKQKRGEILLLFLLQNDYRMREIMHIAHEFLQNFCRNNVNNQSLLHRHIHLFLQSGDSVSKTLQFGGTVPSQVKIE